MTRLMIIVGSTRPGRVGLPVAEWAREHLAQLEGVEIDFVDLAELALPFLDEPAHPAKRAYTKPHTIAWSERVDAAEAFVFVTPEYNHSYSPVLKNAVDFLFQEWSAKPVGFVSYGGLSGGTRAVAAYEPVLTTVGLVKVPANVEIAGVGGQVADGVFSGDEKAVSALTAMGEQLVAYSAALAGLRG